MDLLGHERLGAGPAGVVVLNDWIGDTSSWECARNYLDRERFSWVFADVRGYGRSRALGGPFDLRRAAEDVLRLGDDLGWGEFAVVGHSMTSLVALHLAQHFPERIGRAVVLAPPPPRGFGADDALRERMRAVARGDDAFRRAALGAMGGDRLSEGWIAFKARRWREGAEPEAAAAYVDMFARDGLPDPIRPIAAPVLAVTGEEDAEVMRAAAVRAALGPLCSRLTVLPFVQCGHYPMQEAPPMLAAAVERFLRRAPA